MAIKSVKFSCEGKERFPSWEQANRIALAMRRRRDRRKIVAYRCAFAEHYHIGGQSILRHRQRQTFARKPTRVRIDLD